MNRRDERLAAVTPWVVGALALVAASLLTLWFLRGEDSKAATPGPSWVVCVDSTESTDTVPVGSDRTVRESYLSGLQELLKQAAASHGSFHVSGCGSNATGTVDWKAHTTFWVNDANDELDEGVEDVVLAGRIKSMEKNIGEIVKTESAGPGTPLGEMLSVMAGQCESTGRPCKAYLFTDGEWADSRLKVSDGVTPEEQGDYVAAFESDLSGFKGAQVYFIGVDYGAEMDLKARTGAKEVAKAMVEGAGGTVARWNVTQSLPSIS